MAKALQKILRDDMAAAARAQAAAFAGGLTLADGLTLPDDCVTHTFGILAVRGAGKSNTAAVMAEGMADRGLPFVVVDPVGSWYGLRAAADGEAPGLPIPIFGGKHGDLPIDRHAGELIADLVADQRLSCVLDLSQFDSEAAKKAFLLAFAVRLYRRNENPLHLFLEEADDYVPQRPQRDEAQLLRAWENIVRRGRARGLGVTLITQRSAAVSKMVLTQVDTLIAMRTTGPQDLQAIEGWIQYHQVGRDVLKTLASLDDGEAWVWSPHYLKTFARHQIRRRWTFDSGATPANHGARDSKPGATLADIDLGQLRARMSKAIEVAKATDPRELQRRIQDLQAQLHLAQQQARVVEVPAIADGQLQALAAGVNGFQDAVAQASTQLQAPIETLRQALDGLRQTIADAKGETWRTAKGEAWGTSVVDLPFRRAMPGDPTPIIYGTIDRGMAVHLVGPDPPDDGYTWQETTRRPQPFISSAPIVVRATVTSRILDSLAELQQLGVPTPARTLVAFMAGYTNVRSKAFNNALGELRTKGAVDYPDQGRVALTPAGAAAAVAPPQPRTPADVQARVVAALGGVTGRILQLVIAQYPQDALREHVAAAAGYTNVRSKAFQNALGRLSSLGFVTYPTPGRVKASPLLFLEA